MKFDEMKKIWDLQNKEPLYGINEKALHNHIAGNKKQGYHITNMSELLLILVNAGTGLFILSMSLFKQSGNIYMYCLSVWMLLCALYFLICRIRRMRKNNRFDRSIHGDLHYALSIATYQIHLSAFGRWSILPIGILSILGIWESGKSIWVAMGILIFFAFANYAGRWEHNIYKTRKRELEILKSKIEDGWAIGNATEPAD